MMRAEIKSKVARSKAESRNGILGMKNIERARAILFD